MQENDLNERLAREDFCRLLAACYYQPGPEFAEEDAFGTLLRAAARIDPEIEARARFLGMEFAGTPPEELLLDYTRLFLGPFEILAKPYGSVWLEGEKVVMGDTTMAVRDLYREGGFQLDENFREVPDHIAAELEFLYLLIFKENEAFRAGDAEGKAAIGDLKRRFLEHHLHAWIHPFAKAMATGAETAFYKVLAGLTGLFVSKEAQRAKV